MKRLQDIYPPHTPAVFLAHGYIGTLHGKTVYGVLMHSQVFEWVAVIDREKAGIHMNELSGFGVTKPTPVYATLAETLVHKPKVLILIGNPDEKVLDEIKEAIMSGLDIINSSFDCLADIPEIVELARDRGVKLTDIRSPRRRKWRDANGSILNIQAKVVYIMGTDCASGKRTATFETYMEAKRRGINAAFAATGQTGEMLGSEGGFIFDAIPAEFLPGAAEEMIVDLDSKGYELIFLEGQASISHFAASASIALLHGGNPHAIILAHDPRRKLHAEFGDSPIFTMYPLDYEMDLIERFSLPGGNKFKIVALATMGEENINTLKNTTSLPVGDARTPEWPKIFLDAVLAHLEKTYHWKPGSK